MHGKSVRWLVLGASYVAVSLSVVGCMDYVHEGPGRTTKVYSKPTSHPSASHGASGVTGVTGSLEGATIEGDWKCADATQCNDNLITIEGDSMKSTSTLGDLKSQSVCRIEETSDLKATEEAHSNTYDASITPHSVSVIDSDDNTENCGDVYKEPLDAAKQVKLIPSVAQRTQHLNVDGVPYVRAIKTEIKAIEMAHAKTSSPKLAPWGQTWSGTDGQSQLVFSQDQKSITEDFTENFSGNLNCPVEEQLQITKVAPGPHNSKNELVVSYAPSALVYDGDDSSCREAAQDYNSKLAANLAYIPHVLKFDGTGLFKIDDSKPYLRVR
jgi:hypothetical protein